MLPTRCCTAAQSSACAREHVQGVTSRSGAADLRVWDSRPGVRSFCGRDDSLCQDQVDDMSQHTSCQQSAGNKPGVKTAGALPLDRCSCSSWEIVAACPERRLCRLLQVCRHQDDCATSSYMRSDRTQHQLRQRRAAHDPLHCLSAVATTAIHLSTSGNHSRSSSTDEIY